MPPLSQTNLSGADFSSSRPAGAASRPQFSLCRHYDGYSSFFIVRGVVYGIPRFLKLSLIPHPPLSFVIFSRATAARRRYGNINVVADFVQRCLILVFGIAKPAFSQQLFRYAPCERERHQHKRHSSPRLFRCAPV
jgi:hypothetical protein